ncbi:MAG TPA: hypothetical protein VF067_06805 [Sphingomicrobium sp.]
MRYFPCALIALLLAAPAAPQIMEPTMDPFAGPEAADTIRPKTSYPLGQSDMVARTMLLALKLERAQRDLCWELGCLVIVNESKNYNVTGFYVRSVDRDGKPAWSSNQFGQPLYARRATFRFKTGGADSCDVPVKFVLKHPKTKDTFEFETRASLCKAPHIDSLVRIRAVIPEVKVEGS